MTTRCSQRFDREVHVLVVNAGSSSVKMRLLGSDDAVFHATLPEVATTYALPAPGESAGGLRRFGFHGRSHEYASLCASRSLGGLDALVFTCGVGERSPEVRSETVGRLGFLGIAPLHEAGVEQPAPDRVLSKPNGGSAVLVVAAREDVHVARLTRRIATAFA